MARTTLMKLWTAVVTAFLALCTTLGLITTTAAASVPESEPARNTGATTALAPAPQQALPPRAWARTLPPTMKQRISAEAHGSSPSCRHRRPTDATAFDAPACDTAAADASTSHRSAEPPATAHAAPRAADAPPVRPRHPLQR
jgi:hypothetical protein